MILVMIMMFYRHHGWRPKYWWDWYRIHIELCLGSYHVVAWVLVVKLLDVLVVVSDWWWCLYLMDCCVMLWLIMWIDELMELVELWMMMMCLLNLYRWDLDCGDNVWNLSILIHTQYWIMLFLLICVFDYVDVILTPSGFNRLLACMGE